MLARKRTCNNEDHLIGSLHVWIIHLKLYNVAPHHFAAGFLLFYVRE